MPAAIGIGLNRLQQKALDRRSANTDDRFRALAASSSARAIQLRPQLPQVLPLCSPSRTPVTVELHDFQVSASLGQQPGKHRFIRIDFCRRTVVVETLEFAVARVRTSVFQRGRQSA